MAHEEGHPDIHGVSMRYNYANDGFEHWKYPETVGNDTAYDNINWNSDEASEYADKRIEKIANNSQEPFIMFEFMKIRESTQKNLDSSSPVKNHRVSDEWKDRAAANQKKQNELNANKAFLPKHLDVKEEPGAISNFLGYEVFNNTIGEWFRKWTSQAKRDYTGSIALYMPTDIAINDTMVYNEDTRKIGAAFGAMVHGGDDPDNKVSLFNPTVLTDPAVLATLSTLSTHFLLGDTTKDAIVAFGTYGLGDILSTEVQRSSGKIMNPNELLRYQATALRTFTFNWVFLPDSEDESKQVTGLIKLFRKSAHARKESATIIMVPDHVVVSLHGAADIIQIPPCYVESINVTYNPNNSSFFKDGNRPVEIHMGVTLKEIIPIYQKDVDKGY